MNAQNTGAPLYPDDFFFRETRGTWVLEYPVCAAIDVQPYRDTAYAIQLYFIRTCVFHFKNKDPAR